MAALSPMGKNYDYKSFVKMLRKNGYELSHTKGDHEKYVKKGCPKHISIYRTKLNPIILRRLIKENNLKEI